MEQVKYKLELTEHQIGLVVDGLGQLKAKESFDLILKIMTDVSNQRNEMDKKTKEDEQKAFELRANEYFKSNKKKLKNAKH